MKILLLSFLTAISVSLFSQAGVCGQFHRTNCSVSKKGENAGWTYNAQSKSGLFNQGMTSKIRVVVYKGMDYRINVCCETSLGAKLGYKIMDSKTNEILYDNATTENDPLFEFQSESTRQLIIEVTVPKGNTEESKHKPVGAACVGLLIENKTTDKQGFSKY